MSQSDDSNFRLACVPFIRLLSKFIHDISPRIEKNLFEFRKICLVDMWVRSYGSSKTLLVLKLTRFSNELAQFSTTKREIILTLSILQSWIILVPVDILSSFVLIMNWVDKQRGRCIQVACLYGPRRIFLFVADILLRIPSNAFSWKTKIQVMVQHWFR